MQPSREPEPAIVVILRDMNRGKQWEISLLESQIRGMEQEIKERLKDAARKNKLVGGPEGRPPKMASEVMAQESGQTGLDFEGEDSHETGDVE